MTTTKNIDFIDLKTQQAKIAPQLRDRIERVVAHGKYIMGPSDFPVSEMAAKRIFSLPMHPYLEEPTQQDIIEVFK